MSKLTPEQRQILEKQKSNASAKQIMGVGMILVGIALSLTIMGLIIGIPLFIIGGLICSSGNKEKSEIEFKLAGK